MADESSSTTPGAGDPLRGAVTVITGGGGGIGFACARALVERGGRVLIVEYDPGRLAAALTGLQALGRPDDVAGLALDVRSEDDMNLMARTAAEKFGHIDHLIASAAILRAGGQLKMVKDTTLAEWRQVIDTNLTGTFLSNRAVLPYMIERKRGDIINFSSVSGRQGRAFDGPYCSTKFGIIGLSESLAEEVRSYGVRVQTVLPDAVDTPLWDQNGPAAIRAPSSLPPERVAEFVVFLLSLPRDAYFLNPVIASFASGRKRKARQPAE